MPCFLHTSTAFFDALSPEGVENPAEETSTSHAILLNNASAMGLLEVFPLHKNITLIISDR
jgi:hypothetical protein